MPNRLAEETSPYLKQHGGDPVDWYPWGEEAFSAARKSGRPIFLSVGYASCHWCHVMHRESFGNTAIAEQLNRSFVSVKVDRESRPDVDEHYMAYVVAATGRGGWPMSVFLTPDLVPVFGGTYYPPVPRHGMPSFPQVLTQLASAFAESSDNVIGAANESRDYIATMFAPLVPRALSLDLLEESARELVSDADPVHGGFGSAPKFPQAPVTDFLLAYHELTGDPSSLSTVESAAEGMVRGGIYDQAGGGIARYSVDAGWLVPHFEKMLYDNAQLLSTLAALHRLAPREEWRHVIQQTVAFLERDLRTGDAYASSLDADTDGVEGATFVWSYNELVEALDEKELLLAVGHLGVTPNGNWEGTCILTRHWGRNKDAEKVDALLGKLLELRLTRSQPARDGKLIVAWNALTAIGLLDAGDALGDDGLITLGTALVRDLVHEAVSKDGGVSRLLSDPNSRGVRVLEDAAALALACLRAHEADPAGGFSSTARTIFDRAEELFYDGSGTWYLTPSDTELPVRPRELHDSPTPSGPSLISLVALKLARDTGHRHYREIADNTLARLASLAGHSPSAAGSALKAMVSLFSAD